MEDYASLYAEVAPLLEHVRVMERFHAEVIAHCGELSLLSRAALRNDHAAVLNETFAPHAYALATVLLGLVENVPDARLALQIEMA